MAADPAARLAGSIHRRPIAICAPDTTAIAQGVQQTGNQIQMVTGSISTLAHQALSASMPASQMASARFTLGQQPVRLPEEIDTFLSRARAA